MSSPSTSLSAPTPHAFRSWGRLVLGGGLGLGLLLVVFLTWKAPSLLPAIPLLVLGGAAAYYLFQRPLLNLGVTLAGFVLVIGHAEGINVLEVVYGLYALGFLAHWFVTRLFLYGDRIHDAPEAKAMLLLLLGMTLLIPLSILLGARPSAVVSEWVAMVFLGFYFPIREACGRYRHGALLIVLLLGWIGLVATGRNLMEYWIGLHDAEHLYQIAKGRINMNADLLMIVSLAALVFLVYAERWRMRLLLLGTFLLFFGSLILTQSRALWVSFFLGAGVMFLLVSPRLKGRIAAFGVLVGAGAAAVGLLFFNDVLMLILSGLVDRVLSLSDAATNDISLWSRVVEARGAIAHAAWNPVLGQGLGVPFRFFDIISQMTVERTFIHNGYVSLWYRFGLWGLGLTLFFWLTSTWRAVQVFRRPDARPLLRLGGLTVAICLIALLLSSNTSNPFFLRDTTLLFGLLAGLAGGCSDRARREASSPPPAP